jgi:SAM-dependent methyltransferase
MGPSDIRKGIRNEKDVSVSFYSSFAWKYAEVAHGFRQSVYISSSHPRLTCDLDLLQRLKELAPGPRGLDAGCGAGARDVFLLWREGYDVVGLDAVQENLLVAAKMHPQIADRLLLHDLRDPLPFPDEHFDFLLCNAVIQHIEPEAVYRTVLPEFARVIKPGGVLQLMFKNGSGTLTVFDRDYGTERSFLLYDEQQVLQCLQEHGLRLVQEEGGKLGGLLYFTDPKPTHHCVFFVRKRL